MLELNVSMAYDVFAKLSQAYGHLFIGDSVDMQYLIKGVMGIKFTLP